MANTFVDRYILRADDQTRAAVSSAQKNFQRLDRTAAALKASLAGVAAAFVINRAAGFTSDTLQMAQAIGDVAEKAGLGAEQLQVLRFAADQNGSSADALDKAMIRLNKSIGEAGLVALGLDSRTSLAGEALQALKIDVLDLGGNIRSTGELFPIIIDALAAIENPAERAARAGQIFGQRIGPELAVLINAGSAPLAGFRAELEATGALLSDDLVQGGRATADQFGAIGLAIRTNFQRGFLESFLDGFESLDAAVRDPQFVEAINSMGRAFGSAMQAVVEAGPVVVGHLRGIRDAVVVIGAARLGDSLGQAFGKTGPGRVIGGVAGLAAGAAAVAALRARDAEADAEREEQAQRRAASGLIERTGAVADAARNRVQRETAYSQQLIALKTTETQRITAELARQKTAYDEATRAVEEATRQRAQIEQEFADLTRPARGTLSSADVTLQSFAAQRALQRGDPEEALRQARAAADALRELQGAGDSSATLQLTAQRLQQVAREAAALQEQQAQQAVEQIRATMQALVNEAAVLKTLPVGFDSAQTIADAQALRAAIQAELAANPIVVPVVLDRSAADTFAEQTVQAATVPGRAYGGYIPGHSPHPRADNILIRATAGELMIGRPEVDALRRTHGEAVIAALLQGRLPGYAFGGLIGTSAPRPTAPRPTAAAPPAGDTIHLTLPGVGTYTVQADRDTGQALQQAVRRAAIKSGNR